MALKFMKLFKKNNNNLNPDWIRNIFNSKENKRALVSLITTGYKNPRNYFYHTIIMEVQTLCEVLNALGYIVDLIDYKEKLPENNLKYDLLAGFGQSIEDYIFINNKKISDLYSIVMEVILYLVIRYQWKG
jgi:hypothetical protein